MSFFIFAANSESELTVDPILPMYKPQKTVKIFTRTVWPGSSVSVKDNSSFETFLLMRLLRNENRNCNIRSSVQVWPRKLLFLFRSETDVG